MEKLIVIGAGGYAKSVLDSIDQYNYIMTGFIDEMKQEKEHLGYPILARSLEEIEDKNAYVYFIAIGNNKKRKLWYDKLIKSNLRVINVIDHTAIISSRANIGNGCFVGKLAIINSNATVSDNCIINTKALMEHGTYIADHVNLSTNSVINGDVKVGTGSFIGSGSIIIGQKRIGEWSTVGAGAVVINDVESNITVAGVPARKISEKVMLG